MVVCNLLLGRESILSDYIWPIDHPLHHSTVFLFVILVLFIVIHIVPLFLFFLSSFIFTGIASAVLQMATAGSPISDVLQQGGTKVRVKSVQIVVSASVSRGQKQVECEGKSYVCRC